jgi:hypothetical protein
MMKKILLMLSLLVIGLFLFGCASVEEKTAQGDLTKEELAQVEPKSATIAGQAVSFAGCVDPDSTSTFDKNSLTVKSTTTYASGSFEDKCYTWYARTPQEKTRLIEGTCKDGKFLYWYATCGDYFGKGAKCKEGKCIMQTCGKLTPDPYCVGINLITKTKDTCTGKVTFYFSTGTNSKCVPKDNNTGSSSSSSSGGGVGSLILGQKCENTQLVINEVTNYDCSQEQGWLNKKTCAKFTGEEVSFGAELLEFGNSICKEPCTPGQTITACDDDEYYQLVCNGNGLGWEGSEEQPLSCPEGQACTPTETGKVICK